MVEDLEILFKLRFSRSLAKAFVLRILLYKKTSLQIFTSQARYGFVKKGFSKVSELVADQYYGPYERPIFTSVQRKLKIDCTDHDLLNNKQLFAMHVIVHGETLRHSTDHVMSIAISDEDAFLKMKQYFITPAHRNVYPTE